MRKQETDTVPAGESTPALFAPDESTCVVCGVPVPEGEMVCAACASTPPADLARPKTKKTEKKTEKKTLLGLLFGKGVNNGKT